MTFGSDPGNIIELTLDQGSFDEATKDGLRESIIGKSSLRMPLHSNDEASGAGILNSLDHPIGGARRDPQIGSQSGNRLVMGAVHLDTVAISQRREE